MNLVDELERKLTPSEWMLVERYIYRAQSFNEEGDDASARSALEDAFYVAKASGEESAASKIHYYLRFF